MNVDQFTDEELQAAMGQIRNELEFRARLNAAKHADSEPRPLETSTTDELVEELQHRFDGMIFVGEEWRTDEVRRECGQWKGDRIRLIGMVEILQRRLVTEELKDRHSRLERGPGDNAPE